MMANMAMQFYKFDTDTDSDISQSESSSESEDEEEPVQQPRPANRVRTRGGISRGAARVKIQEDQWKEEINDPQIAPFTATSGPTINVLDDTTPLDVLKHFLTDELIDLIVEETNRYADQYINRETISSESRVNDWKAVTTEELWNFLALTLLMGIDRKPGIPDYWSNSPLFYNSTFPNTMSRNRYQIIHKFLHFADNAKIDNQDRLYKIRPIFEYLVDRFQQCYIPEKEISIDEQLMLHKGNLNFKQYIPNKRAKFGIKIFSLCDNSGYLWNSEVYTGKNKVLTRNTISAELEALVGKSGAVVLRLIQPLLGKGYRLFTDNWYTSLNLFTTEKLKRGETSYRTNGKIVALRYQDKKDVYVLTTMHRPDKIENTKKRDRDGNQIQKNKIIVDYNAFMGGVDKNDSVIGTYNCVRKSHKWTTKVAIHYIEEAVFNAFILYKAKSNNLRFCEFKLSLINQMISHKMEIHHSIPRKCGRHYIEKIPVTGKTTRPTRQCVHCSKQNHRKESRYQCGDCHLTPSLCIIPCFKEYHS